MYCQNCGTQNNDDAQVCASCGQSLNQAPAPLSEEADVQQNKAMAIIAYFIFFIPLLAAKDSPFARYHANQGLTLLIFCVGIGIINTILMSIFVTSLIYGGFGVWGIINIIFTIVYLGLAAVGIIGIVHAAKGEMKPMPVIGKLFKIIK